MRIFGKAIDLFNAVASFVFPAYECRRLEKKIKSKESVDPLVDMSKLMELYVESYKPDLAAVIYRQITATMRVMRVIRGPTQVREHCYVLLRVAIYEKLVLCDTELSLATARRALQLATKHGLEQFLDEALQHDFPSLLVKDSGQSPAAARS